MNLAANSNNSLVLVTGASGFVGRHLCDDLQSAGYAVRAAVRKPIQLPAAWQQAVVGDIGPDTEWDDALADVEYVVHLASYTPPQGATVNEIAAEYRRINVAGSESLARAAAAKGVRCLIYVSTIKVNGEGTAIDLPYTAETPPKPEDEYGRCKWLAEQKLRDIEKNSEMELVILRSPLVYGPGVKGNFLGLLRAVERGLPLPLRCVRNRRSMLYVKNLTNMISCCLKASGARGRTFLVSDGEDVSTPDLIRRIARKMETPAHLWPVPVLLLRVAGRLTGKSGMVSRLTGSLAVDSHEFREHLQWTPPYSLDDGLRETIAWYRAQRGEAP